MKAQGVIFLFIACTYCFSQHPDEIAIKQILSDQQTCWNDGDLECFMEGYWKSDHLVFVGKSGVTYGWSQTLENYKKSYPTKDKMGILTFDLLQVEPLSEDFWTVIGKWSLKRTSDEPSGHFTLIFRRLGDEWVIVSDHSS